MEPTKTKKRIYFACPMFAAMEKEYGLKLVSVLERHGYDVFVAAAFEGKTEQQLVQMIFEKDIEEIRKCDVLFFLLDGRAPDEGGCMELGVAYALGKTCYGFKTDTRTCEMSLDLNPMITGAMKKIFKDIDGDVAIKELEDYLKQNDL